MAAIFGALIPKGSVTGAHGDTHEIALVNGPIHYDLLIPLDTLSRERFAGLSQTGVLLDHPGAQWLVIGWGARQFYTETRTYSDLSLGNIWRGIVGDDSVLRVDIAGPLNPELATRRVRMSEQIYKKLLDDVWGTFDFAANGLPVRLDVSGYTATDGFFAARGKFNILRTCNVWIGERLRSAGLRFGAWTPMPLSVSLSFDLYQTE